MGRKNCKNCGASLNGKRCDYCGTQRKKKPANYFLPPINRRRDYKYAELFSETPDDIRNKRIAYVILAVIGIATLALIGVVGYLFISSWMEVA